MLHWCSRGFLSSAGFELESAASTCFRFWLVASSDGGLPSATIMMIWLVVGLWQTHVKLTQPGLQLFTRCFALTYCSHVSKVRPSPESNILKRDAWQLQREPRCSLCSLLSVRLLFGEYSYSSHAIPLHNNDWRRQAARPATDSATNIKQCRPLHLTSPSWGPT